MSPQPELLSSNVLNYLVWRYLQEAGFGTAAGALARSWNHEPDSLPFAQNIKTHTLIHLVQDGLFLDALQAEASEAAQAQLADEGQANGRHERFSDRVIHKRRYIIGSDHGPEYLVHDERDDSPVDEGVDVDGSPRTNGTGLFFDPLAPGRKRKRKAPIQGHGDMMDIDGTNGTHTPSGDLDADGEDDVEQEVEEIEQLTSTLEIGDSKAVMKEEGIIDLSPSKKIINLERSWDSLRHLSWSSEPGVLALAGDGLLEMHIFADPEAPDGAPPTPQSLKGNLTRNNWNSKQLMEDCQVTAVCWVSRETLAIGLLENSEQQIAGRLITATADDDGEGTICNELRMIPTGMVLALAYHEASNLLLCVETTDVGSVIRIYEKDDTGAQFELVANTYANNIAYDCAWLVPESLTRHEFAVCGHNKLGIFRIEDRHSTQEPIVNGDSGSHARSRTIQESWITSEGAWERLLVSPGGQAVAVYQPGSPNIAVTSGSFSELEALKLEKLNLGGESITSVAFQSKPAYDAQDAAPFLAIATNAERIHFLRYGLSDMASATQLAHTLSLYALAVAFSPSGNQLAVACLDYILLFSLSDKDNGPSLVAQWRPQADDEWMQALKEQGVDGSTTLQSEEHCRLAWDKEGQRIGWSVGNMVCVISVGGAGEN